MFNQEFKNWKPNFQNVKIGPELARQIISEISPKENLQTRETLEVTESSDLGFKFFSKSVELLRHFWIAYSQRTDPQNMKKIERLIVPINMMLDSPEIKKLSSEKQLQLAQIQESLRIAVDKYSEFQKQHQQMHKQ